MEFLYKIYPDAELTVIKFAGKLTLKGVMKAYKEYSGDPLFKLHFKGVGDWRDVETNLTQEEVVTLVDWVVDNKITTGRWIGLVAAPMVTAYAMIYADRVARLHPLGIFSTEEKASGFLGLEVGNYLYF